MQFSKTEGGKQMVPPRVLPKGTSPQFATEQGIPSGCFYLTIATSSDGDLMMSLASVLSSIAWKTINRNRLIADFVVLIMGIIIIIVNSEIFSLLEILNVQFAPSLFNRICFNRYLLPKHIFMSEFKNYYEILQIPQTASAFEIEEAYQKLATLWHPDRNRDNRRQAQKKFHDVNEAYEHLSNRNSRLHYDELLSKQFSLEDANDTFSKFFEENGLKDEQEKKFFDEHYPNKTRTYYDVLQVPRNASQEQIKQAYRRLALLHHPKNNPTNPNAQKKFVEINQAYNALASQAKRQNYDSFKFGSMMPSRAHGIFEDFVGDRFFEFPHEDEFFKPILKKKWSRSLDRMMDEDDSWRNINNGETVKTNTIYSDNDGVKSKKTVTTSRKINNGFAETLTTEQYEFPNGTREVRKIMDDGKGNVTTKIYNLMPGDPIPIDN